jgi:hypothetical protein
MAMREIVFDSEFWPKINTKLHTDLAMNLPTLGSTFWEDFALALSMLAAYDADMLRTDYNSFPASRSEGDRLLSLKTFSPRPSGADIKLRWRLDDGKVKVLEVFGF